MYFLFDISTIKQPGILNFVKKNERLINIALLSKETDYNLPHRVSVNKLKEGIFSEIENEKKRIENEKEENLLKNESNKKKVNQRSNYEDYFKLDPIPELPSAAIFNSSKVFKLFDLLLFGLHKAY